MSAAKLSEGEVKERLARLPGWEREGERIIKKYKFRDFKESMAFVNQIAQLAEEADHHPDITIRYHRVNLTLTTHSAGALTEKDFALAEKIDALGGVG